MFNLSSRHSPGCFVSFVSSFRFFLLLLLFTSVTLVISPCSWCRDCRISCAREGIVQRGSARHERDDEEEEEDGTQNEPEPIEGYDDHADDGVADGVDEGVSVGCICMLASFDSAV